VSPKREAVSNGGKVSGFRLSQPGAGRTEGSLGIGMTPKTIIILTLISIIIMAWTIDLLVLQSLLLQLSPGW
jgi:hypothetical protein